MTTTAFPTVMYVGEIGKGEGEEGELGRNLNLGKAFKAKRLIPKEEWTLEKGKGEGKGKGEVEKSIPLVPARKVPSETQETYLLN